MNLVIRDLERPDLDALLALYVHLHPEAAPQPSRPELEATWSSILGDPAHIYLGAFVDGVLVSAANAAVIDNLTHGARPYAVIENVVTHAEWRRRGIGAKVMHELLDRCWRRECYKTSLTSAVTRGEMHGFYEALGFDRNAKQAFVMFAPKSGSSFGSR